MVWNQISQKFLRWVVQLNGRNNVDFFEGKHYIVTGATSGIGRSLAVELAKKKANVTLAGRNIQALNDVSDEISSLGVKCLSVQTDVTSQKACIDLVSKSLDIFGKIDGLINTAGVSMRSLFHETKIEALEKVMKVNFWGAVFCTQAAISEIVKTKGNIVAVSSVTGFKGLPGRTGYAASKFAMNGFMEALRTELLSDGVSVTIAYPGVVDTDIRRRGFNALGQPAGSSGLSEDKAMPVDVCVQKILQGTERRQRDVLMSPTGHVGRWLKLLAPSWVDRMAWAALKKSDTPR
jgi:short-subunit dehydrogenase